jgi:hypothetical protein
VIVRVFVSLSDNSTRYYPVVGHHLIFYRSANDSSTAVTDSVGALTVMLSPGDYRVVSSQPVKWRGSEYSWNLPIAVRPGMSSVDLRAADAERPATRTASQPAAPSSDVPRLAVRDSAGTVFLWRDPARARSLSWWIAGAGHVYAGHEAEGYLYATVDVLLGAVGATGVWIALNCDVYDCNGSEKGLIVGSLVGSLLLSAYTASASEAIVRRENAAHGLGARFSPRLYVAERRTGYRVGVSVAAP